MKKLAKTLFFAALITTTLTGCISFINKNSFKGNGQQTSDSVTLEGDIYKLVIEDVIFNEKKSPKLVINESLEDAVVITTDKNILDTIDISVDDSTKTILVKGDSEKRYKTDDFTLQVGTPLNHIETYGLYDLDVNLPSVKECNVELDGLYSGKMVFGNLDNFTLNVEGLGDISLVGECANSNIKIDGALNLEAYDFKTVDTTIETAGLAKCNIYVSNNLEANLEGAGVINYDGNPVSVNKSADGVGKISPR